MIERSMWIEFEDLVGKVFESLDFRVELRSRRPYGPRGGALEIDILARGADGIVLPIEVKLSRRERVTLSQLRDASSQTGRMRDVASNARPLLVYGGYIDAARRARIWSCNSREHQTFSARLPHGYISPRQSGSNRWAHIDEAAFIYTSKPHEHERRILATLGVDSQAVIESREFDTIYQFVARTSVRDASSSRPVTAYVYDRLQADALARSFKDRSGLEIELELIDLGFAHQVPGRQDLSALTPAEKAERQRMQARDRKRRQRSK